MTRYFFQKVIWLSVADMDGIAPPEFRFHGRQSHEALDGLVLGHYSAKGFLCSSDGAQG